MHLHLFDVCIVQASSETATFVSIYGACVAYARHERHIGVYVAWHTGSCVLCNVDSAGKQHTFMVCSAGLHGYFHVPKSNPIRTMTTAQLSHPLKIVPG